MRMEMGLEVYEARERERELNQAFNSVVLSLYARCVMVYEDEDTWLIVRRLAGLLSFFLSIHFFDAEVGRRCGLPGEVESVRVSCWW